MNHSPTAFSPLLCSIMPIITLFMRETQELDRGVVVIIALLGLIVIILAAQLAKGK